MGGSEIVEMAEEVNGGSGRKEKEIEDERSKEEEVLEVEEIWATVRKMKKRKAAGIPMESWIYGGMAVVRGLNELLK